MIVHLCNQIITFSSFVKKNFQVVILLWTTAPDSLHDSRSRVKIPPGELEIVSEMINFKKIYILISLINGNRADEKISLVIVSSLIN
jgi:hypothetical protein